MFDQRPSDAAPMTSRAFETARAVVDLGTRSTRAVSNGGKRLSGVFFYFQAVVWGVGALGSMATADTLGQKLFVLLLGCVISGGLAYAGQRSMSRAKMG